MCLCGLKVARVCLVDSVWQQQRWWQPNGSNAQMRPCCCCAGRAARMIKANHDLQLSTGMLVAVPIPAAYAAEGAVIQQAIEESLAEAEANGIAGAEVSSLLSLS